MCMMEWVNKRMMSVPLNTWAIVGNSCFFVAGWKTREAAFRQPSWSCLSLQHRKLSANIWISHCCVVMFRELNIPATPVWQLLDVGGFVLCKLKINLIFIRDDSERKGDKSPRTGRSGVQKITETRERFDCLTAIRDRWQPCCCCCCCCCWRLSECGQKNLVLEI